MVRRDITTLAPGRYVKEEPKNFTDWQRAVVTALREKLPLPTSPTPLPKLEAVAALQELQAILPLRSSLMKASEFFDLQISLSPRRTT